MGVLRIHQLPLQICEGHEETVNPLAELTKKDGTFQLGPLQRKAFQYLKVTLYIALVLQYPNPCKPFVVVTNTPCIAVAEVLIEDRSEVLSPIAFLSRAL